MNELIERLTQLAGKGERVSITDYMLREIIAALSPVLPDEVQEQCKDLRATGKGNGPSVYGAAQRGADLIERLAREHQKLRGQYADLKRENLILADEMDDEIKESISRQQHIERLARALKLCNEDFDAMLEERQIARDSQNNAWLQYEAQGEELKQAQQRIEELESQKTLTSDNVSFVCTQQDFIDLMNENQEQAQHIESLKRAYDLRGEEIAFLIRELEK